MLQAVNWGLSVKEEDALGENFSLLLNLLLFLSKFLHLWCLLEFLRDLILRSSGGAALLSNLELLAGLLLQLLDLN